MTIWFDMDGTLADFYGVEGWLESIIAEDIKPYREADVLHNMSQLARLLNRAQSKGYKLGIISWTARDARESYNTAVAEAKRIWLNQHLHSVHWDEIKIVAYGTSKIKACGGGILFDDEAPNREAWGNGAYLPEEIINVLKELE